MGKDIEHQNIDLFNNSSLVGFNLLIYFFGLVGGLAISSTTGIEPNLARGQPAKFFKFYFLRIPL
jgi:hypothetical protein